MDKYVAVLHKDDDSAYGAYFPDLIGCFAAGDTEDEALENLRISLRIYAEDFAEDGKKLPHARSIHELLKDTDVRHSVAKAAGIMVFVPLLVGNKKRRVNVTLEPSLIAAVDEAAKFAGTNRSDYLASADWRKVEHEIGAVKVSAKAKRVAQKAAKPTRAKVRHTAEVKEKA
jgi:predicted RNase H-like HicB family nuclease